MYTASNRHFAFFSDDGRITAVPLDAFIADFLLEPRDADAASQPVIVGAKLISIRNDWEMYTLNSEAATRLAREIGINKAYIG